MTVEDVVPRTISSSAASGRPHPPGRPVGIAPTDAPSTSARWHLPDRGGQIVSTWFQTDMLALMSQLGVGGEQETPAPAPADQTAERENTNGEARRHHARGQGEPVDRIVTADDATEIANKAIIARYVYATNLMDMDTFDGYVAEDYVEHDPIPGQNPAAQA